MAKTITISEMEYRVNAGPDQLLDLVYSRAKANGWGPKQEIPHELGPGKFVWIESQWAKIA